MKLKPIHRLALLDALKDYEHETVIFSDSSGSIRIRITDLDGNGSGVRRPSVTFETARKSPHPKKHLWVDGSEALKKSCATLREAMTWLQIPYEDGTLPPEA